MVKMGDQDTRVKEENITLDQKEKWETEDIMDQKEEISLELPEMRVSPDFKESQELMATVLQEDQVCLHHYHHVKQNQMF